MIKYGLQLVIYLKCISEDKIKDNTWGWEAYIGLSGDTGNASSVPNKHVHIEVKEKNDQNQWIRKDPKDYLNTQFDDEFQPDPNNSKCNKP